MPDLRVEVQESIRHAIEHLKSIAQHTPDAPIKADDFNKVLRRAKEAFPKLTTVQQMDEVAGGMNATELLFKLSVIEGAIAADFRDRIATESENAWRVEGWR